MEHPDELRLQSYLDGELEPESREQVQVHLERCPPCRATLRAWEALQAMLREARPTMQEFCSGGEFWSRLAGKLPRRRPITWPLVPYLPPLLLGAMGTLVEALIWILFTLYGLISLGVIPSVNALFSSQLALDLAQAPWVDSLYAWLGLSKGDVAQRWASLSWLGQDAVVFVALLAVLIVLLAVVVVLYLSWAVCWSEPARPNGNGGH